MSEKESKLGPSAPITSVQPGGGWCMALELAWARWRRTWLRWFRPGYVARMQDRRLGACPNCCHDVVDARDLKYFRNVCGFRFGEEDRYTRPDRFGLAPLGHAEVLVSALLGSSVIALTVVGWYFWNWPTWLSLSIAAVAFLAAMQAVFFFRDPERQIPQQPGILVSPADGLVTHMDVVPCADFPEGRALRLSIFLSVFDVHVNRAPCGGRVIARHYFPGRFGNALRESVAEGNEQFWTDLEESETGQRIRIKQIAGAIARRIVNWLREWETVARGQRIGLIKFGSRTDLLVPLDGGWEPCVEPGQRVYGGTTIVFRRSASNST
ncbi:MAG: phosphatidylserine decarboxylase [Gemmatales bacterium]|nr:phosphatidylserine decarboxylase [Gemmatales bacterium]MDW7993093.1 phosphatidylserine decarboxylase [Gemmatales bacterium]